MNKIPVAILGSGNIGTDLLVKIQRSEALECRAFLGRNSASKGLAFAQKLNVPTSAAGVDYIKEHPRDCQIVFDATSAQAHQANAGLFKELGLVAIDLTPAKLGPMCIPAVNMEDCLSQDNVNMVTCGGQASIPIAYAIGQTQKNIDYIEVVSSIASRSAGPATRINLDEYIHTTEQGVKEFSGASRTKAILNLNPANPCINMQTTIMAKVEKPDLESLKPAVDQIVRKLQSYVPGYELLVGPVIENERIFVTIRVIGKGDYLPEYAGNLDIINCAAIGMAEHYALHWGNRGRS